MKVSFQAVLLKRYLFCSKQTIIHVGAIAISLISFYTVAFLYNTLCTTWLDLSNSARTIHDTMSTPIYYLIILITPAMALLPRFFIRSLKNTFKPSDDVKAQLEIKRDRRRGENLLLSWSSQSTSKSSIFR